MQHGQAPDVDIADSNLKILIRVGAAAAVAVVVVALIEMIITFGA